MGKDPAFLFYPSDFLVGTNHMTTKQVGMYIICLCYQGTTGFIRRKHLEKICNNNEEDICVIIEKFEEDEKGNLINKRLLIEKEKRKRWVDSRNNNKKGINQYTKAGHMTIECPSNDRCKSGHMENENENKNINNNIIYNKEFEKIWEMYPSERKQGKKVAYKRFEKTVKSNEDLASINKAISNYLKSKNVKNGYILRGSKWFDEWEDWVSIEKQDNRRMMEDLR